MVNADNDGDVVMTSEPKKPWVPVYLTSREVEGLLLVVTRMKTWPKTNLPDGVENPGELLNRLEVIVGETQRDCLSIVHDCMVFQFKSDLMQKVNMS